MDSNLRKSGIASLGDIAWGTHLCHFYENRRDLLDVLIPYFKAGLEQNEMCVWGVFDPLDEQAAGQALARALPDAAARLASGDIEIVPQSQWFRAGGPHGLGQLSREWERQLDKARASGYAGMRINVSPAWLAEGDRASLDAFETEFSSAIKNRRIIVLCAYPISVSSAAEVLDAGCSHRFAIAKRRGNWHVVETPELKQARASVKLLSAELERRAIERTGEIATAESDKLEEAAARHDAEHALRACVERSLCYFELGLVGMAIVSPTGGWIEVNRRLCAILGYSRRELMLMTWAELTHPDDLAADTREYERILSGEVNGYLTTKRWIGKNGDVVPTNVSIKCQRHKDGSVAYFAAMIEEVEGPGPHAVRIPEAAERGILDGRVPAKRSGRTELSGREREVVRLFGLGRTVKGIAAELLLSEKTVSTYRTRLLTKLKLKSTSELILYSLQHHLED